MRLILAIATIALAAGPAHAYFVQPTITSGGGGFINGLIVDGPTASSQGFNNAPTSLNSIVNLADGSIRGNAAIATSNSFGFSQGRFGERVTLRGAQGTQAGFTFAVDGAVTADGRSNPASSTSLVVEAYMAVFDPSAGADASSWFDMSFGAGPVTSLAQDRFVLDLSNSDADLDLLVDRLLSAPVAVSDAVQSFDVFANLSLIAIINDDDLDFDLEFRNSALFGVDLAEGVELTSASGVFLTEGPNAVAPRSEVPLPAAGLMLAAAVGALGVSRRRRAAR